MIAQGTLDIAQEYQSIDRVHVCTVARCLAIFRHEVRHDRDRETTSAA